MESEALGAPSSSGAYAAGERGAGGKLRRPFARKPPSTPYDRPLSQQRRPGVLCGGGGGWISKIVNPAYRLIAGGATRLLPYVFSSSSTSALPAPLPPPPPAAEEDGEYTSLKQETRNENQEPLVDLSVSKSAEDVDHPEQEGRPDISNSVKVGQGKSQDVAGDPDLSYVEQIIKGKTFCREEIDRLMEILQSRVVDVQGGQKSNVTITGEADKVEIPLGNPKSKNEEKQEDLDEDRLAAFTPQLQPIVKEDIGASPVEIAKAYMGSRTSEFDFGSKSLVLKNDRLLSHTDELASNRSLLPPSPKSSICWPGAIIQEQHGCLTPYSQRSRYGLSNHARTPYSRAIHSRLKSKLTPLEGESRKPLDISATPFQKQTPVYGESRIRMTEDRWGSVGPIRRLRHRFVSETPRGSPSLRSSEKGSLQVKESILGDHPLAIETFEPGIASTSIESMEKGLSEADTSIVHPHTSKVARQILEQISRTPTRKEKSEELKLVIAKKNSSISEVSGITKGAPTTPYVGGCPPDKQREKSFFKVPPTNRRTSGIVGTENDVTAASKTLHKSSSSFGNSRSSTTIQDSFEANTIPHPHKGKVAATNLPPAGTQALNTQKGPIMSGTKPFLPPISINKSNHRVRFASDNCTSGFTFPTAPPSSSSEPPTPSIMPFSSAPAANPPRDATKPPTYTFGEKKSGVRLVFSFPSTSNASAPNNTPVFKFSSGESRVSFSSVGKDAVCC